MASKIVESDGTIAKSLRPQTSPRSQDEFTSEITGYFGAFTGAGIAKAAIDALQSWGINPADLVRMESRGGNSTLYSFGDKLAIKVTSESDRPQKSPLPPCSLILPTLRAANIGFDMGNAPVTLSVVPLVNTANVKPWHVRALCHEHYTKYSLLFSDNKLENVGLSADGTPYVIDLGAVKPISEKSPLESPFYYPEMSGFNVASGQWASDAPDHHLTWPLFPEDIPAYKLGIAALGKLVPHLAKDSLAL